MGTWQMNVTELHLSDAIGRTSALRRKWCGSAPTGVLPAPSIFHMVMYQGFVSPNLGGDVTKFASQTALNLILQRQVDI